MIQISTILCSIVLLAVPAVADDPAIGKRPSNSELGFLEEQHDYVIRFATNSQLFKTTTSGISPTSYTTEGGQKRQGKPATWTITMTVEIFHVVKFGGGSWVLLEHPSSPDDFAKWNGMRRALAQLTDARIPELESSSEGKERIQELRKAASREIPTSTTWVNLDHAVAIADVSTEPIKAKLKVNSVKITGGD